MGRLFFTLSLFLSLSAFAAEVVKPVEINPSSVDRATFQVRGPHLVYTTNESPNGKLLITLGGTGSLPSDFRALHSVAVDMGYQVIALDYQNAVISTSCRESADVTCFDGFRREVVLGEDFSDLVKVSPGNAILHRILSLIAHLRMKDSRWEAFLVNGKLDWSRVVLVGHSQGSGHAAFLAKLFSVNRVVMIAGPQDNFDPAIAGWIKEPGKTEAERFYSLVHRLDFFKSDLQIAVFKELIGNDEEIFRKNAIVSDKQVRNAHMELIQPKFSGEWRRLLGN